MKKEEKEGTPPVKIFDLTKFAREYTKKHKIETGFSDPETFMSSGSYALDHMISNRWPKDGGGGFPLEGQICMVAGSSGSGKSLIISGQVVKWCRANGVLVVLFDAENAVSKSWIRALGVNPDDTSGLLRIPVSSPDDVASAISDFMKSYNENNEGVPKEQQQKVLFVIDSLGMLMPTTEQDQFADGSMRGQFGARAKQLKQLMSNLLRIFSNKNVGCLCSNHVYQSSDMFKPGAVVSGGEGIVFAASIIVTLEKFKLKEDENGVKLVGGAVRGIRSKAQVMKSRFAKPFEQIELLIPWTEGLNPYTGLVDLFEGSGVLVKSGNKLEYISKTTGEVHKLYRKEWLKSYELLDLIMNEWDDASPVTGVGAEIGLDE
jgi:RecA/RadA recombinase